MNSDNKIHASTECELPQVKGNILTLHFSLSKIMEAINSMRQVLGPNSQG